tara:strand:+ start:15514 stop:16467 length:954 start_codon:yes stop_codon:yes gene_type:complete
MIKIIGGSGFIGSRLKSILNNYVILDKSIENNTSNNFYCDITVPSSIEGMINKNDTVILLAAEHKDNVKPISKYYETNVIGTKNILNEMDKVGCKRLIFTSSVAIYGLNKNNPSENYKADPFNHYGKSKYQAENIIMEWYNVEPNSKFVTIIRPSVVFGEGNRGNVYNLLRQIYIGKFILIGNGKNKKSMAYVGNLVDFIKFKINDPLGNFEIYNYTDYPDLTMLSLVEIIKKTTKIKTPSFKIPIFIGLLAGYIFDFISYVIKKDLTISSIRIKKFIATTQFNSTKIHSIKNWKSPYTLKEGLKRTLDYEFNKIKE